MSKFSLFLSLGLSIIIISCHNDDITDNNNSILFNFTFQSDSEGWIGDFADYPNEPNVEEFYEFEFSHTFLPVPLNINNGALRQSGFNHSDDLFMFIKKKISGLKPSSNYQVSFEIEFATNAPSGTIGIGGAPGEGVFIKAGASSIEPNKFLHNSENFFRMNIDKGNQSQEGNDMKLLGDFSNKSDLFEYKLKVLTSAKPISVTSDSNGEIWLIVGTDSGFEGTTTIYYNSIKVNMF